MHPASTIQAALGLAAGGATQSEVARQLGLSRATVKEWLSGRLPRHVLPDASTDHICPRCGHARHEFLELGASYTYLLGLYLGDGYVSSHPRGVYQLRIVLDIRYPGILRSAAAAVGTVSSGRVAIRRRRHERCADVASYSRSWPCLLPQHGPGLKHERAIVLTDWQEALVERWPEELLRGLIQSDGCRFQNTGRGGWVNPRYSFVNRSADIRSIFCRACEYIGVGWTASGAARIYVSRKADVALLDRFIGAKA
jgi:transcriptional regulator with XRE-family HTH domain